MLSYCFEVTADNAEQVLPPKEDNSALASLRNRIEAFRLDENGLEKDYFIFLEQYHGNQLTLVAALTAHLGREPQDFLQSLGLTGIRLEKAEDHRQAAAGHAGEGGGPGPGGRLALLAGSV